MATGFESCHSLMLKAPFNEMVFELNERLATLTNLGVWEMRIKSVASYSQIAYPSVALECSLVKQLQLGPDGTPVTRGAPLECLKLGPPDAYYQLHNSTSNLWYEISNPSTRVQFHLRNVYTDELITSPGTVCINMVYRRRR